MALRFSSTQTNQSGGKLSMWTARSMVCLPNCRVRNKKMKLELRGLNFWVMWPAASYLVCYLSYIICYLLYLSDPWGALLIVILIIPLTYGLCLVFPCLGLLQVLYVLHLFFKGSKMRVKPHLFSVLCSLVLYLLTILLFELGYYPTV